MRIMVVDDDPDVILVLERILGRYGCEVIGVTESKKCLATVKKERPDIIFLDIMMPGVDGWELCKKIKEDPTTSDIYISMVTVRCEREDKIKSLKYSKANRHLCKPINADEIKKIVAGVESSKAHLDNNSDFTYPAGFI